MSPTVLVLNCGSSSVKYELIDPTDRRRLARGLVERIGEPEAHVAHTAGDATTERTAPLPSHRDALRLVLGLFDEVGPSLAASDVCAVGHRVVMGGQRFDAPVLIDDEVAAAIADLSPLAPLHNPPNLEGIAVARALLPDVPHVAVFDTAFFHGLPPEAATYAIDRRVAAEHSIRRFGFHGTSHAFVAGRVAEVLGRPLAELRQIVLHLGNGASAAAIVGGRPVETSMGMTPLEGLVMGTRTGDIDPAVVFHLVRVAGMGVDQVDDLFNRRSGMRGLTGHNDMREVHRLIAEGDAYARLALDVYVHRLKKYVGAYTALMGGLDALTFTAGVGEHDAVVRAETARGLDVLGIAVDDTRNTAGGDGARVISPEGSPVAVLVVPTDEELAIALHTAELVGR